MNNILSALVMSVVLLGGSEQTQPSGLPPQDTPPRAPAPTLLPPVAVQASAALPWLNQSTERGVLADAAEAREGRKLYLLPQDCSERSDVDVVIHFHGSPKTMTKAFRSSHLDAVAVIVNLGALSGPYEHHFEQRGSFVNFLAGIDKDLAKHCPGAKRRRLAISSWSGGYGAAYRILVEESNLQLIDAILLSDGLHSAMANKFTREVKPDGLAPFERFAALAARGEKLFAMAHSSIVPPGYSSTTETATYLLESQGAKRVEADAQGPRESMHLTSKGSVGSLTVLGFEGNDTHAHCDHLYAINDTLFTQLERRWAN
ncbi:MAG: hypothetical protein KC766_16025 [Myxococcales bacterium]|nr:hypothetical protein [Myxococcales bacterium]